MAAPVHNTNILVMQKDQSPGCLIRGLWYIFIGWWAAQIAILFAYLAMLFVITMPLAFWIFNRLPTIFTLRPHSLTWEMETQGNTTTVRQRRMVQRPWWQRAIYFVLIGWWFGFFWLQFAWLIGLFIIPLPLTFWMMNRVSGVMTLERH